MKQMKAVRESSGNFTACQFWYVFVDRAHVCVYKGALGSSNILHSHWPIKNRQDFEQTLNFPKPDLVYHGSTTYIAARR